MTLSKIYCAVFLSLASLAIACSSDEKLVENKPRKLKEKTKNFFGFYKDIEIRPGLNFEILSWGKGKDSVGGISVLMSDSLKSKFKAISLERKGIVKDAWNLDLDTDGNPEFYIELQINKTESDLLVYEFADGDFQKISFPSLSDKTRKLFAGNDAFFIKGGELYRKIPVFENESRRGTPIINTFRYILNGKTFQLKEMK